MFASPYSCFRCPHFLGSYTGGRSKRRPYGEKLDWADYQGMSFFRPFFFLLLDSALGSDLSGAAAVCSLLVPLPAAAAGVAVELDSVEDDVPPVGAEVLAPAAVPVAGGPVATTPVAAGAADSAPAAGAGCSAGAG